MRVLTCVLRGLAGPAAAALTAALVAAGFAPWEEPTAPFLCLIPLLLLAARRPPAECAQWGFLAGLAAWLVMLAWLLALRVTAGLPAWLAALAWITLSAYCALYTALFAWGSAIWLARVGTDALARNVLSMAVLALFWTGLEVLRSRLFTGFPWNPLGATLAPNLPLAQGAEFVGVHGLSAFLVWVNAGFAFTLLRYFNRANWSRYRPHLELFLALAALAFLTVWGRTRMREAMARGPTLAVALVQPAIPQNTKWDEAFVRHIHETLGRLTEEAGELSRTFVGRNPDLIVWPETAIPTNPEEDPATASALVALARQNGPILVGVMGRGSNDTSEAWFNRSLLIDGDERPWPRYDKQHLVLFGEYLPFDKTFPVLKQWAPLGLSLSPGREPVVFSFPRHPQARFSVTICFEDLFPHLSRRFVHNGARLLINQSNDAWFDGTAQLRQHLNLGLFRCIENRVPGIRVSNSGLTGFIEPTGRVYHGGLFAKGHPGIGVAGPLPAGQALSDVGLLSLAGPEWTPTFFARWGEALLLLPSAALALIGLGIGLMAERQRHAS